LCAVFYQNKQLFQGFSEKTSEEISMTAPSSPNTVPVRHRGNTWTATADLDENSLDDRFTLTERDGSLTYSARYQGINGGWSEQPETISLQCSDGQGWSVSDVQIAGTRLKILIARKSSGPETPTATIERDFRLFTAENPAATMQALLDLQKRLYPDASQTDFYTDPQDWRPLPPELTGCK
jgi:hypothetical protein